jgi:hypothetical protein
MLWELCSDPEKRRSTAKVILDGRTRPFHLLLLFSFCHYSGMSLRVPCCKELMEAALIGSHLHIHINRMNALAPADNFTRISRLSNCQAIPKRLEIAGRVDLVRCKTHGTYVSATSLDNWADARTGPGWPRAPLMHAHAWHLCSTN